MMRRPMHVGIAGNSRAKRWHRLRDKLRGEQNLVIIFGSEIRGGDIAALVDFGSGIAGAKFVCLADYANSRGAADMGLYPDLLPGYRPVTAATQFHEEWGEIPQTPGLNLPEMVDAAKAGKLKALYVVGSNPVARYSIDPFAFSKSFRRRAGHVPDRDRADGRRGACPPPTLTRKAARSPIPAAICNVKKAGEVPECSKPISR